MNNMVALAAVCNTPSFATSWVMHNELVFHLLIVLPRYLKLRHPTHCDYFLMFDIKVDKVALQAGNSKALSLFFSVLGSRFNMSHLRYVHCYSIVATGIDN